MPSLGRLTAHVGLLAGRVSLGELPAAKENKTEVFDLVLEPAVGRVGKSGVTPLCCHLTASVGRLWLP